LKLTGRDKYERSNSGSVTKRNQLLLQQNRKNVLAKTKNKLIATSNNMYEIESPKFMVAEETQADETTIQ
jgi:hypothetical protein